MQQGILNVPNRTLYHGDNLDFMRALNSNSVHLIATDPPFNKGRDFHATPDSLAAGAKFQDRWSWDHDVHEAWKEQIQDDWPAVWFVIEAAEMASGQDMAAFLCWLGRARDRDAQDIARRWKPLSPLRPHGKPLYQSDARCRL